MSIKVGNSNNIAREVSAIYVGDNNGIARLVSKIYMGDATNKAKVIYEAGGVIILDYFTLPTTATTLAFTNKGTSSGGGNLAFVAKTQEFQHNQWVTFDIQLDAEGNLSLTKSGTGTVNNPVITDGWSSTYSAADQIEAIELPSTPGDYSKQITIWWDNTGDSNPDDHTSNLTLTYTVVEV